MTAAAHVGSLDVSGNFATEPDGEGDVEGQSQGKNLIDLDGEDEPEPDTTVAQSLNVMHPRASGNKPQAPAQAQAGNRPPMGNRPPSGPPRGAESRPTGQSPVYTRSDRPLPPQGLVYVSDNRVWCYFCHSQGAHSTNNCPHQAWYLDKLQTIRKQFNMKYGDTPPATAHSQSAMRMEDLVRGVPSEVIRKAYAEHSQDMGLSVPGPVSDPAMNPQWLPSGGSGLASSHSAFLPPYQAGEDDEYDVILDHFYANLATLEELGNGEYRELVAALAPSSLPSPTDEQTPANLDRVRHSLNAVLHALANHSGNLKGIYAKRSKTVVPQSFAPQPAVQVEAGAVQGSDGRAASFGPFASLGGRDPSI